MKHDPPSQILEAAVAFGWKVAVYPYERRLRRKARYERFSPLPIAFESTYNAVEPAPLLQPDYFLGHRPRPGEEFIGRSSFVSIRTLCRLAKANNYNLVVNIGDSSTSGWDSNVVTRNRHRLLSGANRLELPFFHYKTYSDYLSDMLLESHPQLVSVNAGVPGFSSIQGLRYLTELLTIFRCLDIQVAAVTIYFGNNDCSWNANYRDSLLLPGCDVSTFQARCEEAIFDSGQAGQQFISKKRLRAYRLYDDHLETRVTRNEYLQYIGEMCNITVEAGAKPIVIIPAIPLDWFPGERVRGEPVDGPWLNALPGGRFLVDALARARSKWYSAKSVPGAPELVEAAEEDYLLPRVKAAYVASLRALTKHNAALLDVEVLKDGPDREMFLDYCHPLPVLNSRIAERIISMVEGNRDRIPSDSPITSGAAAIVRRGKLSAQRIEQSITNKAQADRIYPLY
jgi:hypothetical protein